MQSFLKNNALRLCGVFIFITILTQIDLASALNVISGSDKRLLIISILLIVPLFLAKSLKWFYLLKIQELKYPFVKVLSIYLSGFFLGSITPAKIGEFGKIFYLKKENHSYSRIFFSILVDRLSDIFLLFILCIVGIFFFVPIVFEINIKRLLFFFTTSAILILALFILKAGIQRGLKKIFKIFFSKKILNKINFNTSDLLNEFRILSIKKVFLIFLFTCFAFTIHFVLLYIAALALGINISFFYLVISLSIAMIINFLPISFMGIGTRDLTLIVLFSSFDISREITVAFSSIMLFFVMISIVLTFPFFLSQRLKLNENKSKNI